MPNLKRLRKKRALQKKAHTRQMAMKKQKKAMLGTVKMEDRMIQHHQDILQNIEFAMMSGYRNCNDVDDSVIADALKAVILSQEPEKELSAQLIEGLDSIRQMRNDLDEDLWRDGLRTVLRSVQRHSNLHPGSTNYIDFVSTFVI